MMWMSHINYLELLAVKRVLASFLPLLQNKVVQVVIDKTSSMYCINKQGGT